MDEANKGLLTRWDKQLAWKQKAHTDTARWLTLKTSWIGYPAAALSALAGTSIVASFVQGGSRPLQLAAIVLSLSAAVLSAIQTQTRSGFLQEADQHRIAAAHYGNLRREIERIEASPRMSDDEKEQPINRLQERFDELDLKSPRIPKDAKKWWRAGKPPHTISF
jgi:conflict system pore-forming effector with SLATT domain